MFWIVLFLVTLLVVSVSLLCWYVWPVDLSKKVDSPKLDQEYRNLLQKVTTLLSEYEVTHFVYGETLSDLRRNRYLSGSLCVAVDDVHREMMEGLERHHIKNDFSMSVDMFQLEFKKSRFMVKNRKDIDAIINFYKLENGKIKFEDKNDEIDMDLVFPVQAEVMDNLVVMMPSRIVGGKSKVGK